jgi:AcrR family transcriptional regulator
MPDSTITRRRAKTSLTGQAKRARPRPLSQAAEDVQAPDRRAQILAASARLFAEFGFESTSVRQIADEVNILAGSLYHHFATKEEILHEIIREPILGILRDFARISQLPADAEHKLVASVLIRFHQYVRDWDVHAIILHDSNFFRRREDFSYVENAKSKTFRIIEAILKEGMDAGQFRSDIDIYLTIGTIARILSAAAHWFRSGTPYSTRRSEAYSLDEVIDFHLDCILRIVRSPARINKPIPRKFCEQLIELDKEPA